ncbi:MAG TPA: serine/threonine-protein kinase [Polyangiaceae bacterium]|nr:serine/threonine-protein kinase [Polyangiaceae bacterium]
MSSTVEAPSAPRNTEEGRALLQARLSQFGRVGMGLSATFLAIAVAITLALRLPGGVATIFSQIGWFGISFVVWAITRRGVLSTRALLAVDVIATQIHCAVGIALGWGLPIYARPELVQLVFINDLLAIRAFLVPSTSLRTALLGVFPTVGVVVSMLFQYDGRTLAVGAPSARSLAVVAATLGFATVVITTLTSRTIFSLRERVRAALQLGQYTLLEKLGEGGMGVVYKASHAMLKRPTAIKVLPPERAGQHNLARFEREVQLTSMLTHPNTVSIYDYGRTPDGCFYYAMEYLDGVDLETLIAIDGPQEPARVVHILSQVCGALSEAHGIGLVHRDVKPANVLVCVRGGVADLAKIVDFGLVKSLQGGALDATHTAVDQIVGTPLYMAPEAMTSPDSLGPRSDLYALGAVAYYLLTGSPPFTGQSIVEICAHHLHTSPRPVSEQSPKKVPEALERVVMACLAKRPEDRPESADALARWLAACDIPAWSNEQARAWWETHADAVQRRRAEQSQSLGRPELERATVAIEFASPNAR